MYTVRVVRSGNLRSHKEGCSKEVHQGDKVAEKGTSVCQ